MSAEPSVDELQAYLNELAEEYMACGDAHRRRVLARHMRTVRGEPSRLKAGPQ